MIRKLLAAGLLLLWACGVAIAQPGAPPDPVYGHIAALMHESAALVPPGRVERALMLTLRAAQDAAREGHISTALTLVRTFAFEVRGVKRAKRLSADAADVLIARAEDAIRYLSYALHIQQERRHDGPRDLADSEWP
jgi:hypothetical protein